ncbi:type I secretion C-terminal target domain-containing protein [Massilia sp. CCM 8733]|uniref:Type I secretion C-terminal target domain-containing protein n=1 Tax=Massilia mucilaginosa TaxID=2609282 RepID=A0ABX0P160_9BURK|nr:calcium-binding protein [Massilia mucilaginosa]NHZ92962.1 type I secretion C-terminal target domain-containing protein [Massilia mucilaginosa]
MPTFFMLSDADDELIRPENFLVTGLNLTGTADNDILRGGALDARLFGLGGADLIFGSGGNDYIDGGDEDGPGDRLYGGGGADSVYGGGGDDYMFGDAGNDLVDGEGGMDQIDGGAGDDVLRGGDGADYLHDDIGSNIMVGGAGNDHLLAMGPGADRLEGGADNDMLEGGTGHDSLYGGAGMDAFNIGAAAGSMIPSNVLVSGGDGDDRIAIFPGTTATKVHASGGAGSDLFVFAYGTHDEAIFIDDFSAGAGGDRLAFGGMLPFPHLNPFGAPGYARLLQQGSDTLVQIDVDGAADTAGSFRTVGILTGVQAQDLIPNNFAEGYNQDGSQHGKTIEAGSGNDKLYGGVLDDTIDGGAGNDQVWANDGNDVVHGGDGNDDLSGSSGNDLLGGGAGDDYLHGQDGNDTLNGGGGDDMLDGHIGDDVVNGGDGNDQLYGSGGGNDVFNGGNGNDRIGAYGGQVVADGGAGDDTISSEGTAGLLNGGSGNDIIKVQTDADVGAFGGAGRDRIEIYANDYLAQGRVVANGGEGDDAIILIRETQNSNLVTAIGGDGSDRFGVVGSVGTSIFSVRDFAVGAGGDRIDVSALLSVAVPPGDPFVSGALRYLQSGNDTLVQFDADGAAGPQANFVTMMKLQGVLATTLTTENLITVVEPAVVGVVAAEWAMG